MDSRRRLDARGRAAYPIQLREFRQEGAVVKGAGTGPALVEMDRERLLQGNVLRMTDLISGPSLAKHSFMRAAFLNRRSGLLIMFTGSR